MNFVESKLDVIIGKTDRSVVRILFSEQSDTLEIKLEHLIAIAASGNYVEIWVEDEPGKSRRIVRRITMQSLEAQLAGFPQLMRIHRAWFVNLERVERSSGNAQGYTLLVRGMKQFVPVSRRNIALFNEKIEPFRK